MRRGVAALLLFWAPALLAQPGLEQRAYLELFVNDGSRDTVLVYLRGADTPDDALVAVADVENGGLRGLRGNREMHDGREYVSLRSLAPEVEFRFDPQALAIRIVAQPAMLETIAIDLRPVVRPTGMVLHRDTSGFMNYSLTADGRGTFSGSGELGASLRGNLAFTGFSVLPDHSFVRGLSYLVLDDPSEMRRIQLGDAIGFSSDLGGTAQLSGISVTREFALDPYFVRQPLPRLSGAILTPSTLDVYMNGTLLRHEQIAPGPFEVRNLPVGSGVGQVSYVVRDAFGRTQEFASPYYAASGVLADGISEYGYHLGFRRLGFGQESTHYGSPELLARHRIGIGDRLTVGYRLESALQRTGGTSLLASGGPNLALALPVGELDLEAAASTDGAATGAAGSLSYTVFTRRLSAGGSIRAMSASYSNLSLAAAADRPLLQLRGAVGAPVMPRVNVALEAQLNAMRDVGLSSAITLRGYQLRSTLDRDQPAGGLGQVQYQGAYGTYLVNYDRVAGSDGATATAAGALVLVDGIVMASRPVREGYALIQVPGLEGVRGFLNNQEIGRTNGSGNLLVPSLQPYYGNRLRIGDADIPIDYQIGAVEQVVATTVRGGALVPFDVQRVTSVKGMVRVDLNGHPTVPAFGELRLDSRLKSPLGADGQFWFEDLGVGTHLAEVEFREGTCRFELVVPKDPGTSLNLGTVSCSAGQVAIGE